MEFPSTPATWMTERIMLEVRKRTDTHDHTKLNTTTYNRIYEAVFDTIVMDDLFQVVRESKREERR